MQSTHPRVPLTPCIEWMGAVQSSGYGSVTNGRGGTMLAHRRAWEAARGPIPPGLTIDHLCRHKLCVNPDHMEVVTNAENVKRMLATKTHCKQGHPLSGDNLAIKHGSDGYTKRQCRECARAATRRSYHAAVARGENPNAASVARRSARRAAARASKQEPPAGIGPAAFSTGN